MLSAQSAQIHSAIVSHLDEQKIVLKELVQHSEIHFQLGKPVIQGGKYYGTYLLPVKLSLWAKDALQTLIDRDDSILLPFEEWYELDIYDVQPDGSARVNLCVGDLERNCERTLAELNTARSEMLGMLWDDAKELEKIVLEELGQRAGKFKEDIAVTSTLGDVMQLQPD